MWVDRLTIDGRELELEDVLADVVVRHGRTGAYDAVNAATAQVTLLGLARSDTAGFHVGVPLSIAAGGAPRFVGTVTDATLDDDELTVIAAGPLSTLSRYKIGAGAWPAERWSDRVTRAFAEAGVPELLLLQYDDGWDPLVVARGDDPEQPPATVTLLDYLATLADDVAAAIADTPDGRVLVQQLTYRTMSGVLTWATAPGAWADAVVDTDRLVVDTFETLDAWEGWTDGRQTLELDSTVELGASPPAAKVTQLVAGAFPFFGLYFWPDPPAIVPGRRYRLRARLLAPAGQPSTYFGVDLYNNVAGDVYVDGLYYYFEPTGAPQTLALTFTAPAGAFNVSPGFYIDDAGIVGATMSVDDVELVEVLPVSWADAGELGAGPLPVLVVDPADVLYVPAWEQALAVENETTVTFGDQESVTVAEPASVDRFGSVPGGVATELLELVDAERRATERVRRLAWPRWVITSAPLLRGHPLTIGQVVELSGFPPSSPHASWRPLLEGWTDTIRGEDWNIELALSDAQLSGVQLMWVEIPAELAWSAVAPACSWKDAVTLDALYPPLHFVAREELSYARSDA